MKLLQANESDNDRLRQFFSHTIWPGPVQLRFERRENFFTQYKNQSDDFVTLMLTDKTETNILGMATLVFREGVLDGQNQIIGYATDLRVANSRRAVLQWSQHFLPVLEKELNARNCNYVFSVVSRHQRQAYNAFIRPRSPKRQLPRYYLFRRFDIVGLHGLWPFAAKPLPGITINSAVDSELPEVCTYIHRRKKIQPMYFGRSPEEIYEQIRRWQSFETSDFLVARDSQRNIIGCVAPWSSRKVQRVTVGNLDAKGRTFSDTLRMLSFLGIAHRLPMPGSPLPINYLTHLFADNPDIFYSLLYNAWKRLNKSEVLAYPHFETHIQNVPPRSFISSKTSCGLYCVMPPNVAPPSFLKPTAFGEPPDFELPFL
ncbi:MAG: hypothetical protein H6626_01095 [Pseudobdellovibrionaceae bacterium]|nr:MAG: hypothetical protein H6626_01095 [Pseudobdellovibrionaceae bacterium]